jgi:chemotaxis protein MotB
MARPAFYLVPVLIVAVLAGSGCVPIWNHYNVVKKNEEYLEIIGGYDKKFGELNRTTQEAVSERDFLKIQVEQLEKELESAKQAVGTAEKKIHEALTEGVKAELSTEVATGEVKITKDNKISIAGDVLFPSGKAELTAKAQAILLKIAPMLKKPEFARAYIRVEGHTDNQPIVKKETLENYATNWHLSVARAISVLMELKKLGVPEDRMYAAGYGEWMPRVANQGKKGHPENRRVEIAVMDKK